MPKYILQHPTTGKQRTIKSSEQLKVGGQVLLQSSRNRNRSQAYDVVDKYHFISPSMGKILTAALIPLNIITYTWIADMKGMLPKHDAQPIADTYADTYGKGIDKVLALSRIPGTIGYIADQTKWAMVTILDKVDGLADLSTVQAKPDVNLDDIVAPRGQVHLRVVASAVRDDTLGEDDYQEQNGSHSNAPHLQRDLLKRQQEMPDVAPAVIDQPAHEQRFDSMKDASALDQLINKYATRYAVDERFINGLCMAESSGGKKTLSSAGARGEMQLMPKTFYWLASMNPELKDINKREDNIHAAVMYFDMLYNQFKEMSMTERHFERFGITKTFAQDNHLSYADKVRCVAVAAYNCGPNKAEDIARGNASIPYETKNHIKKVVRYVRN